MRPWRVEDVMTKDVVSVRAEAPYHEVVDLLINHRISALPVVTRFGQVIGVVSEADLLHKVEANGAQPRVFASLHHHGRRAKAAGRTAGDVMTAPAVTAGPSMSIAAAAHRMRDEHVKRLPVVDEMDRLLGIVTPTDLLKVHLRSDALIRADIVDQIIGPTLGVAGSTVQVTTAAGVVTLRGRLKFHSTVDKLVRLSRQVPGVVAVTDDLRYDIDDSFVTGSTIGTPFGVA